MKNLFIAFAVFTSILALQQACTKIDTTTLGVDLIPEVDNITTFDTTMEVVTDNFFMTDVSKVYASDLHALGIMQDPSFGTTTAKIYVNMFPQAFGTYPFGGNNIDSIAGQVVDSVVLQLAYSQLYGDSNSVQTFRVSEIDVNANFEDSTGYPVNTPDFPTAGLLGSKTVTFTQLNDADSVMQNGEKVSAASVLRIPLNNSFGNRFLQYDTMPTGAFKNDSVYRKFFKGFEIMADNGSALKSALAYFNLASTETKLIFYYKIKRTGQTDTASSASFVFRGFYGDDIVLRYPSANLINRNTGGTNYAANIANPATNKQELYIQSSPGSYATVVIPGLENLNNRLIYRAELSMDRLPALQDDKFGTPNVVYLDAFDTDKNKYLTLPNVVFLNYQQGTYTADGQWGLIRNEQYAYNITRYVQGIVTRKEKNYPLRLSAPNIMKNFANTTDTVGMSFRVNYPEAYGRVVIGGGSHPTKKMKLRIIYSKI